MNTKPTSADEVIEKTRHGAEMLRRQIQSDIRNFSLPVKIERYAWAKWLSEQFAARGCDAMSREVGVATLLPHAKALAFDILYDLGGYNTPELCVSALLDKDNQLAYWRAIAIAANAKD